MNLLDKNISELIEKMESEEITSEEIVKVYIDKIKSNDSNSKYYSYIDEDVAIETAKKIDIRRQAGEKLSKLAGIPVGVTDEISTKGTPTSAGSKMLEDYKPPFNASLIDRLKKSDMIIMGKIAIEEFGLIYSDSSSKSILYEESILTIGSDAGGNLRVAASRNGLFSMKPTYGSVSRYGVISATSSLDTIGVTSSSVEDLARVLNSIVGYDKRDSSSVSRENIDYETVLGEDIKGMKIALPKEFFDVNLEPKIKGIIEKVIARLKALGVVFKKLSLPSLEHISPVYDVLSSGEFSSNVARYDGIRYGYRAKDYNNLEELYKESRSESFGDEAKKVIMFGNFVLNSKQYDVYYKKAQSIRTIIMDEFYKAFDDFDLILAPLTNRSDSSGKNYTLAANITGLPAMTIPSNSDNNIGFQIIGDRFKEENLLKLAYAYEKTNNDKGEVNDNE